VEKGALRLDAEVRSILPEFTLPTAVPITIKHLLSHHAGLPHTIDAGDKSQPKSLSV
jgi:CubicO group peptidase (beta-lactamase class C family)